MPLNDRQIKNAKPTGTGKKAKLFDGGGLYLEITPAGGKIFRLKYRIDSKEKTLTIGKYPAVSLSEARQAAENARRLLSDGQDPAAAKQQEKQERKAAALNTFEALARRWHADNLHRWQPVHAERILADMQKDVFPHIGQIPLAEVSVSDVKNVLAAIVARGANVTAEKVRQRIGAVYTYAAMLEITDRNPAVPLRGHFEKKTTRHMPALPREELAEFYRRLILADIEPANKIALLLTMLVFVRNTELRGGQWVEVDFSAAQWIIPAERMKAREAHSIPLSIQAVILLKRLHAINGRFEYVFLKRGDNHAPMNPSSVNIAIKRFGYSGRQTAHGFRGLARTWLAENGVNFELGEACLSHRIGSAVAKAYNHASYLTQRKAIMQQWADFIEQCSAGSLPQCHLKIVNG